MSDKRTYNADLINCSEIRADLGLGVEYYQGKNLNVYVGTDEPADEGVVIWVNPDGESNANLYATIQYVDDEISKLSSIDTDDLATKEYVDAAVSNVKVDLSNYYTKDEVDDAIANNEVDLSDYYTKSQVDDLIPSTSGFITMEDVDELGYTTEEDVNTLINTALGVIENGTY